MRVFKKQISASKVLLCASLLANALLVGIVYIAEKNSHVFEGALVRRGIIQSNLDTDKLSPDYWARAGWTNTIEKLHAEFDIAFFGNSIIRGSDFQLAFPDKKIINLGYSGNNLIGMLKRVPMIQKANPKKVFIMAGTNDLVHISLDEYKKRYANLISTIQDSIQNIDIYLQSVLPSNHEMADYAPNKKVQQANEIVKELAGTMNCRYINLYDLYVDQNNELPMDLTPDGVHLFPQSYEMWAEKIRPYVYE